MTDPPLVVVLDELAMGLQDKTHGAALTDQVARIVATGRSGGVWAVVTSQRAVADAIPTDITSQCDGVICCRVSGPSEARVVLGDYSTRMGWHPEEIRRDQKGRAVVKGLDCDDGTTVQGWMPPAGIVAEVVDMTRYDETHNPVMGFGTRRDYDFAAARFEDEIVDAEFTDDTPWPGSTFAVAELLGPPPTPPPATCAAPGCVKPPSNPGALYCGTKWYWRTAKWLLVTVP